MTDIPCRSVRRVTAPRPTVERPVGLWQAKGDIHALHGGAGGALGQVVERGDGDQPARIVIDGDLDVNRR